jgi:16S rRNA (cytidine1402-2'-O)-methyltransferase
MYGKLYVVPTPIGNLEDITFRAINTLKSVKAVLTEDTRTSGFLLKHFQIETRMFSFHKFNEHLMTEKFVSRLKMGEDLAIISDAGTPGISDPAYLLIKACVDNGVEVFCLPGATALIPALVMSGLPTNSFVFEGFLPHKKGRMTKLKSLLEEPRTIVLYESPHRIQKLINELKEYLGGERKVCISREISKKFEENIRGTLKEVSIILEQRTLKGEIVVVVEGKG